MALPALVFLAMAAFVAALLWSPNAGRAAVWGNPFSGTPIRFDGLRVAHSSGWGVPLYQYRGQRDDIGRAVAGKSRKQLVAQASRQNRQSIDGLPGLDLQARDTE